MKKNKLVLIAMITVNLCYSQNVNQPQLIPPSPNAQTFLKYGEYPVSNYTGVPDISVPIYTIKLKDLTIPIRLSYNASGIRVEEEASRVGLGWILDAGGVISQTIKGRHNDFNGTVYFNKNNGNKLKDLHGLDNITEYTVYGGKDFTESTFSLPDGLSLTDVKYGICDSHTMCGIIEMAPDIFNYNFQGYSGKFIFGRDGNIVKEKTDNIKIIPTINQQTLLPTCLESFEIITPDGTKYYFNQTEKSYIGQFLSINHTYNSSFYLTKIETINKTIVNFLYTKGGYTLGTFNRNNILNSDGSSDITINYSKHESVKLSEVQFPGGKIKINYVFDRLDYSSEPRVQSIKNIINLTQIVKNQCILYQIHTIMTNLA